MAVKTDKVRLYKNKSYQMYTDLKYAITEVVAVLILTTFEWHVFL